MKKTFFSLLMITCCTVVFAQTDRHNRNSTPQSVRDAFTKEHPATNDAQWQQSNGHWHATYTDNTNNRKVDDYYDNRGKHMYSRVAWDRKNLPGDYDKRIRTRYHTSNYRVTRVERTNNQPSLFELIFNIGGKSKTVYTDERGNEVRYRPGY